MKFSEEYYTSLIGEVFDGYSVAEFGGNELFIKHINIRDQRYIHKYYEFYKNRALSKGIESEKDVFKRLIDDGMWEESDDMKIASLVSEIENLKKTKDALFLPSKKESFQKTIDEKSEEVYKLRSKKHELVGVTAEAYATNRSGDEMLRFCLFKDPELKKEFYSEDEFAELEIHEVRRLNDIVLESHSRLSEDNIKHAVLRPFFGMYLSNCKNLRDFYGKAVVELSVFQLKTAMYGKVFDSIFQYTEDVPENIKEDPDKLLAFSESQRNKDSGDKGHIKEDADASAVFGATKEDMEQVGGDARSVSLSDELEKAGGKLDMKQMMRLAGHDV